MKESNFQILLQGIRNVGAYATRYSAAIVAGAILVVPCFAESLPKPAVPSATSSVSSPKATVTIITPGLKAVNVALPDYSEELRQKGVSGRVKVALELNRAGEVTTARVTESTNSQFEVPSIKSALKSRFKKGLREGEIQYDFGNPTAPVDERPAPPVEAAQNTNITPPFTGSYVLIKDVDKKPVMKSSKAPVFPVKWAKLGVNGEVSVAFIIDAKGLVTQVRVVTATNEEFASAAVESILTWRFTPAKKDGKPIACLVNQTLSFALDD